MTLVLYFNSNDAISINNRYTLVGTLINGLIYERLERSESNHLGGILMNIIGKSLHEYIATLNDRFERGTITQEKYMRVATKLVAWENEAIRKGLL